MSGGVVVKASSVAMLAGLIAQLAISTNIINPFSRLALLFQAKLILSLPDFNLWSGSAICIPPPASVIKLFIHCLILIKFL